MGRIKMTSDEYERRAADLHALLSEAKSLANYDFPSALVKAKLAAEHASSLLPAPEQIQFHFFYASCLLNCGNISEALTCIDIAHKYKMKTKLIDSEFGLILLKKGVILINLNRGKPAIPILEQALQMFIRLDDQPNIVLAYLNMAQGYDSVYAFHDALECLFKALDLAKKLGHDIFLGRIYLGLGNVYANTQDHKSSTKYLKLCSALAKKINNPQLYASALGNLGRVYTLYKKFDLAKKTTLECLAIAEKYQNPHEISRLCNNLGIICNEMADYPEALSYLNRAVQMESIESNPVAFIRISLNIARSYSKLKEHSIAIKSLEEVIIHAKEINAQDLLVPAYLMAHDAMREQGSYKEALEYYIQYTETLNAIWNRDKELEFKQLESDFDNVKKQQQAEIYKLKNVQLKKRNKLINLQKSQLETALHNLQIANENKEKLFSIIAHDLRGPLSNIYQGIELALSPLFPAQDKNQFLDEIQKSAFDIYKLTENLLSWSGKQLNVIVNTPQPSELQPIFESVIQQHESLIRAKRLHLVLRIDAPKPAFLDKNLFGVVMRNLLSNAIKFSQFDGTIILEVCPISDKYLCSITDQGTGIPADILSRLFDKNRDFISSGTNAEKGIGLGLLLCREFIELMGSTIDVVSEQNKGSTFSFSVPICQ